jgi:predicted nucleic acid-binding protein
MILYLDASALVKRYLVEAGSAEVNSAVAAADLTGTGIISRAEVSVALAKAVRMNALTRDEAEACLALFRSQWADLVRIRVTETLASRAGSLAWEFNLRGYDAVHLAAAAQWQDAMEKPVTLATFDKPLWLAAQQLGMAPFPYDLQPFLARAP